ncbi:MAG TPA: hypothetical protein VH682_30560, partial [Gemmataceae bacterium]
DYQHDIFVVDTAGGKAMLRESVDASEKDVVLVVPFIGHREAKSDPAFVLPNYNNESPKVEAYLKKLCDTIKGYLGATTIGRLVIACHSGSGDIMMQATAALGKLEPNLKECWGYDCMYGNDYKSWMDKHSKQFLYFYQGSGSYSAEFRKHWMYAYGSPKQPKKPRLNYVFLAPGTKYKPADMECLTDAEVFQSFEAIQLKKDNKQKLSDYESFRLNDLDPLLDSNPAGWANKVDNSVKSHYVVVQDLVTPRIVGLFDATKPSGANVIAHIQAQCKSGVRAAPPPPQKPGQSGAGRSN